MKIFPAVVVIFAYASFVLGQNNQNVEPICMKEAKIASHAELQKSLKAQNQKAHCFLGCVMKQYGEVDVATNTFIKEKVKQNLLTIYKNSIESCVDSANTGKTMCDRFASFKKCIYN